VEAIRNMTGDATHVQNTTTCIIFCNYF
jgi:hypothetical protein